MWSSFLPNSYNNILTGISDTTRYSNKASDQPSGPGEVRFLCGVNDEVSVDGWKVTVQD